jgi:hypothetical protein
LTVRLSTGGSSALHRIALTVTDSDDNPFTVFVDVWAVVFI